MEGMLSRFLPCPSVGGPVSASGGTQFILLRVQICRGSASVSKSANPHCSTYFVAAPLQSCGVSLPLKINLLSRRLAGFGQLDTDLVAAAVGLRASGGSPDLGKCRSEAAP